MRARQIWLVLATLPLLGAGPVEEWRKAYEEGLRAPYTGWLSVAGLFWLHSGENSVGAGEGNDVVLPRGTSKMGVFVFDGKSVVYRDTAGAARAMRTDVSGAPDTLEIDGMRLVAIERNGKFGIRLRDPESAMRKGFAGCVWYPIRAAYKVRARFIPHAYPRTVNFTDMTGNTQKMVSPGVVEFVLNGHRLRLEPVEDEGQLFFVFRDRTANKGTYGAGRMLYAPLPVKGFAELDFNVTKNMPCVYTPYATCPLPPKQNILPVAIEAGEKMPAGH